MDANHSLHEKWTATSDHLSKLAQKYEKGKRFVFDLSVWYFPYTRLGYEGNSAAQEASSVQRDVLKSLTKALY